MQQLLSAVARIHECSLAHQDIKPDNVLMVTGNGCCSWTLKLADFGLAQRCVQGNDVLHVGGGGTVPYMSPEQLGGWFDCSCDVWALRVWRADY